MPDPLHTELYVDGKDASIELNHVSPAIIGVYDQKGNKVYSASAGDKLTVKGAFFGVTPPAAWLEYAVYEKNGTTVKGIKLLRLKCDKVLKYSNSKNVSGKSCMNIETGLSEITVSIPKLPKNWDNSKYHNIVIDNKVCRATIKFQTEQ